jgi:hypothetical protein
MGGTYIFEGETLKLALQNAYLRKAARNGKLELVCKDLSQPKADRTESGSCEGGVLPLVSSLPSKTYP